MKNVDGKVSLKKFLLPPRSVGPELLHQRIPPLGSKNYFLYPPPASFHETKLNLPPYRV